MPPPSPSPPPPAQARDDPPLSSPPAGQQQPTRPYLVAVHAGAGYHRPGAKEAAYVSAVRRALAAAAAALNAGGAATAAVRAAIEALEDDPATNAGFGSNLTRQGTVECDAAIMDGSGACGAVGAVPGLKNPIGAAHRLAELSTLPLPCGLVRPTLLAGDAARRWALGQGLHASASAEEAGRWLVSPAAEAAWAKYSALLEAAEGGSAGSGSGSGGHQSVQQGQQREPLPAAKRSRRSRSPPAASSDEAERLADVADTVGCVVVDERGVAAGVSSGGLALKLEGRVGEAAIVGAGCWAAAGSPHGRLPGVAVSVSGVGERIMSAGLARAAAMCVQADRGQGLLAPLLEQVLQSQLLSQPGPWDAGVLLASVQEDSGEDDGNDGGGGGGGSAAGGAASSGSSGSSSKGDGGSGGNGDVDGRRPMAGGSCEEGGPPPRRLQVQLAAAFASRSFAVGYLAPRPHGGPPQVHAQVLRQAEGGGGGGGAGRPPLVKCLEFSCGWALMDPQ